MMGWRSAGYESDLRRRAFLSNNDGMNLPQALRLWLYGVCALVSAQAIASFWLARSFTLVVLSDLTQLILLLSATIALV